MEGNVFKQTINIHSANYWDYFRCQNFFPIFYSIISLNYKKYIQNRVSLHGQRNGVLCLVGGALENISLSLQFAHGSKTHFLGFEDSTSGIFDCVVLSTNNLCNASKPFNSGQLIFHLSLQFARSLQRDFTPQVEFLQESIMKHIELIK